MSFITLALLIFFTSPFSFFFSLFSHNICLKRQFINFILHIRHKRCMINFLVFLISSIIAPSNLKTRHWHMCLTTLVYYSTTRAIVNLKMLITKFSTLSNNASSLCLYICIWQLSSFRAPRLWFTHLTVAICQIQYIFRSLHQLISRENG